MPRLRGQYWFKLRNEHGMFSVFAFGSFRRAWERARVNGNPQIFFTDMQDRDHECAVVDGQEGYTEVSK